MRALMIRNAVFVLKPLNEKQSQSNAGIYFVRFVLLLGLDFPMYALSVKKK
jgi:hypothetical protein